jgi:hypothetical protein
VSPIFLLPPNFLLIGHAHDLAGLVASHDDLYREPLIVEGKVREVQGHREGAHVSLRVTNVTVFFHQEIGPELRREAALVEESNFGVPRQVQRDLPFPLDRRIGEPRVVPLENDDEVGGESLLDVVDLEQVEEVSADGDLQRLPFRPRPNAQVRRDGARGRSLPDSRSERQDQCRE